MFRVLFGGLDSGLWIIQIGCSVDTAAVLGVLGPFNVSVDTIKLLLLPFPLPMSEFITSWSSHHHIMVIIIIIAKQVFRVEVGLGSRPTSYR